MISIEYITAALLVIIVPGTGVIYTISIALMCGAKKVFYAALGCTLSIFSHLLATVFGVAAILNTSIILFNALKLLGVLYLLYMAYCLYKDKGMLEFKKEEGELSDIQIIKSGFLLNIFNPKLSIFFLAFIPQFVSSSSMHPILEMTSLGLLFMFLTLLVFIIYGFFASKLKNRVDSSPNIMKNTQKCFAFIFTALAYKLARA